jgi:hypothetical protein
LPISKCGVSSKCRWNGFTHDHDFIGPNVVGYLAKWQSAGLLSRNCRFDPCDPDGKLLSD